MTIITITNSTMAPTTGSTSFPWNGRTLRGLLLSSTPPGETEGVPNIEYYKECKHKHTHSIIVCQVSIFETTMTYQ
jgi:hypothetical protein